MLLRHALLAAMITTVAATANAQTTPPTTPSAPPAATAPKEPMATAKDMPAPNAADARKLIGRNVKNPANETIGEIKSVYITPDGKVDSVMVGVGGFLGVGEHLVAVPFDKIKFVSEPVAYTGAANAPASGTRPPSTTTTGAATTTSSPPASANMVKANPWYPDHALYNATKDELKAMPEFKYSTN